jgi:hypothetical protein
LECYSGLGEDSRILLGFSDSMGTAGNWDLARLRSGSAHGQNVRIDARSIVRVYARKHVRLYTVHIYIYPIYTCRWYVRNYVWIMCRGGDHSKKVILFVVPQANPSCLSQKFVWGHSTISTMKNAILEDKLVMWITREYPTNLAGL